MKKHGLFFSSLLTDELKRVFLVLRIALLCIFLIGFSSLASPSIFAVEDVKEFDSGSFQQNTKKITGTVVSSEDNLPIPGVNIIIPDTGYGTITDSKGKYELTAEVGQTLQFLFIGMKAFETIVGDQSVVDVVLEPEVQEVSEVVVTALGIKRETKSLGYAVSKVSAEEITVAGNTVNPVVALYGKASGVGIRTNSAGPTGAVDIKIRGAAGLEASANTRPLFVVDGTPIYDTGSDMASRGYDPLNSFDYGSGINDVNPEDIESIEILKGAKATVLYGTDAANGVVLITTKKGAKTRGMGVSVSSQYTWELPHSYIDFQNEYGSGENQYDMDYITKSDGSEVRGIKKSRYNFGPKLDGTPIMFLDSIVRPYQAYPDNYIDLFKRGSTFNTTVAISGASEKGSMRFSYTNYDYNGILDNFYQDKNTISFGGVMRASEFATFEVTSNLYSIKTNNRYPNIQDIVAWGINRDYPFSAITDMYKQKDGSKFDSEDLGWPNQFAPAYLMNILWEQYENNDLDDKFHYIGSARVNLKFTPWLSFVGQAGLDYTDIDYSTKNAIVRYEPQISGGKYSYKRSNVKVQEYKGLLNFEEQFLDDKLNVMGFVGGSFRQDDYNNINVSTFGNFYYPEWWWLSNGSGWPSTKSESWRVMGHSYGSKVMYSAMFSGTIGWDNTYYFEFQGRNDWSSTLDPDHNSFFYPGVAFNWNFTNTFHLPFMRFGKFRMAWADVGRPAHGYYWAYKSYSTGRIPATDAYTVSPPGSLFGGDISFERKREFEVGFDGRFFQDSRLEASMSYYTNNIYDQIMGVNVPPTSGFGNIKLNAGNVRNSGFELFLKGSLIKNHNLQWDLGATASIQGSKIKKLYPGITEKVLSGIGNSVKVTASEGERYGDLYMYDYLTDGDGNRVVDENGFYVLDKSNEGLKKFGNITEDVFGGLFSDIYLKGFNFHVGVDYKFGGNIFSYSNYYLLGMGISKETLKYRDEAHGGLAYYINDLGVNVPLKHGDSAPPESVDGLVYHDGVITPGVVRSGGTDENPEYAPNKTIMSAKDYYSAYVHDMSADFQPDNLYKNDYVKLRELALSYTLPQELVNRFGMQKLTMSLIARNLLYLYKSVPNIDAESTLGTGSYVEKSAFPSLRSVGFGLNVSF